MNKGHKGQMSDRDVMKLALEALEWGLKADELPSGGHWDDMAKESITALRQALEQPSDIEAAVRAENEACAKIVDAEIKLIGEKLQSIDERINSAIAIRARMKND